MSSDEQLKTFRDIFVAAGQVFLASLVIPYFVGGYPALSLAAGVGLMLTSWSMALMVSKRQT